MPNPVEQAKKMMNKHEQELREKERIDRLQNYEGDDEVILASVARDVIAEREKQTAPVYFKSGIPKLDDLINGFIGGELTVISGITKHGKTLLAQTFTRNMNGKIMPMWFTYEVRMKQFFSQFGDDLPGFVVPQKLKQNDPLWIEDRILEGVLKYDVKAVFLDNTHNALNLAGDNLTHKIDEFIKRMKEIAVTYNVHFFLLHHIMKNDVARVEDLNSNLLRDSSMIPQTADNVFFIFRDEAGAWLKITENRREGVFNKSIRLQKVGRFFEEVTEIPVTDSNRRTRRRRDVDG